MIVFHLLALKPSFLHAKSIDGSSSPGAQAALLFLPKYPRGIYDQPKFDKRNVREMTTTLMNC